MSEGIKYKYNFDLAFLASQVVRITMYARTDITLACAALVKYDMNKEYVNPAAFITVVTSTFTHEKGKVLLLY
ncbi:MAG: hypothetical protein ACJA13_001059 [Paraglaciecola sp.]|jgi:hypothetical protein